MTVASAPARRVNRNNMIINKKALDTFKKIYKTPWNRDYVNYLIFTITEECLYKLPEYNLKNEIMGKWGREDNEFLLMQSSFYATMRLFFTIDDEERMDIDFYNFFLYGIMDAFELMFPKFSELDDTAYYYYMFNKYKNSKIKLNHERAMLVAYGTLLSESERFNIPNKKEFGRCSFYKYNDIGIDIFNIRLFSLSREKLVSISVQCIEKFENNEDVFNLGKEEELRKFADNIKKEFKA